MIASVVMAAINHALDALAPRFGLRSHALPTEEHLDACVDGLEQVITRRGLTATHVIIGSSRSPARRPRNFAILPCDDAAAEATRIRSEVPVSGPGPHLLYFNSDSTPGEAGLSELDELTALYIALSFAEHEGLQLLMELASSSARVARARVLDAGIPDLALYADLARKRSEHYAAPLLGFLAGTQTGLASAARAAHAFDALSGTRAAEAMTRARVALEQVSGAERDAIAQTLRDRLGFPSDDPLPEVIRLCGAGADYARGKDPDPRHLCGLTAELASALRAGASVVRRLVGELGDTEPAHDEAPAGELSDAELLRVEGAAVLRSEARYDIDGIDTDALPRITLLGQPGEAEEFVLRPNGRDALVRAALQLVQAEFWQHGGTLYSHEVELFGDSLATIIGRSLQDWSRAPQAFASRPPPLIQDIDAFLTARAELLAMLSQRVSGEADDLIRTILVLEHFPLLVAAQLPDAVAQYVHTYEALIAASLEVQPLPVATMAWLANMDLALSVDRGRFVRSACLLPMHPLRLAHAQLWIEHGREPPPVPMTLGVYVSVGQPLSTAGRDYAYTAINKGNPSDAGLATAAREGLEAAWRVLRARDLTTALQVELVNVTRPAVVVNELVGHAAKLLDEDADAPGIHFDVRVTYSTATHEREVAAPPISELADDAVEATSARRGDGVSLSVASAAMRSGEPCDLAIEAVDAPYVRLPDAGMAVMLPSTQLIYHPGASGNIALIEISGFGPLDQYHRLLVEQLQLSREARGLDPLVETPRGDGALITSFVARRGWPVMPRETKTIVSRQDVDDHIVVTTLAADVFQATVPRALSRVTAAAPDLVPEDIVTGALNLYSCRSFLRAALDLAPDVRDLRGKLGKLRAYEASRQAPGVVRLVLDLDGGEGLRWIQTVSRALRLDNRKRCDLLFIDADEMRQRVLRLSAVELKAGDSRNDSTPQQLADLAHQAQLTASRLRATFAEDASADAFLAREALRRLYWMGAGTQLRALELRAVLEDLDLRLATSDPPPICVECWVVPEAPRAGERDLVRELPALTPNGDPAGEVESVAFHFLDPVAVPIPGDSPAPSTGTLSSGTSSSASASLASRTAPSTSASPSRGTPSSAPASPARETSASVTSPRPPASLLSGMQLALPSLAPAAVPTPPRAERTGSGSDASPSPSIDAIGRDGMRIVFGATEGAPAVWLPNRTDLVNHFNVGVTGTMGTGKTQFTKSLLAQLLYECGSNVGARRPGVLIFDYKGDYSDGSRDQYARAMGLRVLQPEDLPINPLCPVRPTNRQQFVALPRTFADTLRAIDSRMGNVQRHDIIQAVQQCYAAAGITDDPLTWSRQFPTVEQLFHHMTATGIGVGTPQSIVQDLADYGVFTTSEPTEDLDNFFDAAHVIDLRRLSGAPPVVRAILCFFMNAFHERMVQCGESPLENRDGHTLRQLRRLVLVDEADDFISLNLRSLTLTMQQGRSFGHGVILSTQFLHHFNQNETPLRPLIGTWVVHQMTDVNPSDVKALFGLSSRVEMNERIHELATLPQHTSLCLGLSSDPVRSRLTRIHDLAYKDLVRPAP